MFLQPISSILETEKRSSSNLTSPKILNNELFPHPFGPQTNTFIPERTWGEKREHINFAYTECGQNQQVQMANEPVRTRKNKQPALSAGKRSWNKQQPDWLKRELHCPNWLELAVQGL